MDTREVQGAPSRRDRQDNRTPRVGDTGRGGQTPRNQVDAGDNAGPPPERGGSATPFEEGTTGPLSRRERERRRRRQGMLVGSTPDPGPRVSVRMTGEWADQVDQEDETRDLRERLRQAEADLEFFRQEANASTFTMGAAGGGHATDPPAQRESSSQRPKMETPDHFNGEYSEEVNVLNWIDAVEAYLLVCNTPRDKWPAYARSYTGSKVKTWWTVAFRQQMGLPSWGQVKQAITARYLPPDHALRVQVRFETTGQYRMKLVEYVERFQVVAAAVELANLKLTEKQQILQFIRGLTREEDRRYVLEKEPETLDDCYNAVVNLLQSRRLSLRHLSGPELGEGKYEREGRKDRKLHKLEGAAKKKAFAEGRCIGCGKAGHFVAQCPDLATKVQRIYKKLRKEKRKVGKPSTPRREFKALFNSLAADISEGEDSGSEDEDSDAFVSAREDASDSSTGSDSGNEESGSEG
jgi:hypothetical protein